MARSQGFKENITGATDVFQSEVFYNAHGYLSMNICEHGIADAAYTATPQYSVDGTNWTSLTSLEKEIAEASAKSFDNTDVNSTTNVITLTAHLLQTGHKVHYDAGSGYISGLVDGEDYFVIRVDANSVKLAATYNDAQAGTAIDIGPEASTDTLTFPAKAAAADGEYLVLTDADGVAWAVAVDLTGSSAAPTGDVWEAIDAANKAQVDLSTATTAAEVAAAFEAAFNGITDFTDAITLSDSAADGTMTIVYADPSAPTAPNSLLEDDSDVGNVTNVRSELSVADYAIYKHACVSWSSSELGGFCAAPSWRLLIEVSSGTLDGEINWISRGF